MSDYGKKTVTEMRKELIDETVAVLYREAKRGEKWQPLEVPCVIFRSIVGRLNRSEGMVKKLKDDNADLMKLLGEGEHALKVARDFMDETRDRVLAETIDTQTD